MNQHVPAALHQLASLTGRRYPALWKALEALDGEAAADLARLARDLFDAILAARRMGACQPWHY